MNATQILTLATSIGMPLSAHIYGNWRIQKARKLAGVEIAAFDAEFPQSETTMSAVELKSSDFETRMDQRFERMNQKLDTILKILTDREARLPK